MLKRFIIFLIRKKLGLKKYEKFRFKNQSNTRNCYYFGDDCIWKFVGFNGTKRPSGVSLNHLLSDECEIERIE